MALKAFQDFDVSRFDNLPFTNLSIEEKPKIPLPESSGRDKTRPVKANKEINFK